MVKKMLIDAAHPEETRVVVMDGNRVDDFDFETQTKRQLRGNIYLAKVTRVEPSLQAAFVEYGGNRHGFLAFGEIHPDYYQIPSADRERLKAEVDQVDDDEPAAATGAEGEGAPAEDDEDEQAALEERRRRILTRRYKIQEVIRRRQIMLVQVVKEERGSKGAALTTYLSLAGRYCVLMPNTGRGGGISRKITNSADRKRLKKIATELEVPAGMGLIVRTAGAKRTKTEIKRDYEYLIRAWENIRDTTLRSVAPALIYEESSLVKRAIRDLYDKDVEDIHVDGEAAYREAKDFVRMLMPSHAKKVAHWKDPTPIFTKTGVERQLESIYSPVVNLRSGGYLVINQTEALVSIDVNSGRSTRERNIEQTALKTNLEAAEEAARQMRLRDLAGLVVIDFIDMEEAKNDRLVEKRMKDCLRFDRARVQMGKISAFGLLELSRQRRRTGILEGSSHVCAHCQGTGRIRSVESSALRLLRALDEECARRPGTAFEVRAPAEVALYVLNEKRAVLAAMEESRKVRLRFVSSASILAPDFEIAATGERVFFGDEEPETADQRSRAAAPNAVRMADMDVADAEVEDEADVEDEDEETPTAAAAAASADGEGERRRRRRRGRRGGKRRREDGAEGASPSEAGSESALEAERGDAESDGEGEASEGEASGEQAGEDGKERSGRRRRRRRRRGERGERGERTAGDTEAGAEGDADGDGDGADDAVAAEAEQAPRRTPTLTVVADNGSAPDVAAEPVAAVAAAAETVRAPVVTAPAAAPVTEAPVVAESDAETTGPDAEPSAEPADGGDIDYAPDRERREKFFARLTRWGKKTGE
ncbi:MAG: ribonuclease E/G [Alphaproteobacteria bacterium]|nr:ribonuclease E/G [Alphaproteobacteria bacterium]